MLLLQTVPQLSRPLPPPQEQAPALLPELQKRQKNINHQTHRVFRLKRGLQNLQNLHGLHQCREGQTRSSRTKRQGLLTAAICRELPVLPRRQLHGLRQHPLPKLLLRLRSQPRVKQSPCKRLSHRDSLRNVHGDAGKPLIEGEGGDLAAARGGSALH